MAYNVFDNIDIPQYSAAIFLRNIKTNKSDFIVDISNVMINDIQISKERNKPDSCKINVEYTQFKKRLEKENTIVEHVLLPWVTEIVIKRNFKTVFCGYLNSMSIKLSAVGKEELNMTFFDWGEMLEKRYISRGYGKISYPEMAQKIIMDSQHELNWIDNYAFEASDNEAYFSEWILNNDPELKPERADQLLWSPTQKTGIKLKNNDFIISSVNDSEIISNDNKLYLSFYYIANNNCNLKVNCHDDNGNIIQTYNINLQASTTWKKYNEQESWENPILLNSPTQRVSQISFSPNSDIQITEIQLYRTYQNENYYDLGIKIGNFDNGGHNYQKDRVRHFHKRKAKECLYSLANLVEDNFEYQFDENKNFNIWFYHGRDWADPVFVATYPGDIQSLSIERDISEIENVIYGRAEETIKYTKAIKEANGKITKDSKEYTKVWSYSSKNVDSMKKYGAMQNIKSYDNVNELKDIVEKTKADLKIFSDINVVPSIEVDANIYNPSNLDLGDAVGVKVLNDGLFKYINGTYRVYSYNLNVSIDSVEKMGFDLIAPNLPHLQIISFPQQYKNMLNDINRLKQ